MQILWINEHASFVGGCEHYIYNTVKLLEGHQVSSTLLYDPKHPADPQFAAAFKSAAMLQELENKLADWQPDLIFIHQLWDYEALQFLGLTRVPVIKFFHDNRLFSFPKHSPPYPAWSKHIVRTHIWPGVRIKTNKEFQFEQQLNRRFDGYIAGSAYMRDLAVQAGFDGQKIAVIPLYAMPAEIEMKPRESDLLLYAGTLTHGKGADLILHALAEVKEPWRLAIAGSGNYEGRLKLHVDQLGLQSQVAFLGKLSHQQLMEYYDQAACLLFPVREPESFGLVGPEAMRHGTPVIGSDKGPVKEWLENEVTGLLVPPEDYKALAQAIERILRNKEFAKQLGEQAKQRYAEKFTPEIHLSRLLPYLHSFRIEARKANYSAWGRFTPYGSQQLEQEIAALVAAVAEQVKIAMPEGQINSLLLTGGYGKGEGGVENVQGHERPHNNLDLLLISKGPISKKTDEIINQHLAQFSQQEGIGIDLGCISKTQLQRSRPLLLWYEMIRGHKTLLGDDSFVKQLPFADWEGIEAADMRQLLVNRGTLLLINTLLLAKEDLGLEGRKLAVRHMMKAVIGYGDALLFFLKDYHWSYLKKGLRMAHRQDIEEGFKELYRRALQFRFIPDYTPYLSQHLPEMNNSLLQQFAAIYLRCESIRLKKPALAPKNYFEAAAAKGMHESGWLRFIKNLHWSGQTVGEKWHSRTQFRLLAHKKQLSLLFPILAFQYGTKKEQRQTLAYFEAPNMQQALKNYLRLWGELEDANFYKIVQKYRIL